jgi:co-chaperonin GroES (HSP10)
MLRVKKTDVAVIPIFDPPKTHKILNAYTGKEEGLIIPETAKERSDQGIVKYIGSEVDDVYYGDHVMYAAYDGTLVNLSGEGLLIILPRDKIVATIHPPETKIDGIYFKSKLDREELEALHNELKSIIREGLESGMFFADEIFSDIAKKVMLAGFMKEQFHSCTYEMTTELIAQAITNADWKDQYRFKERKQASPHASKVF